MTAAVPTRRRRLGPVGNSAFLIIGQSTQALGFGAISLFLPLIRQDIGISFTEAGSLAAVGTLVYAIMMVPAGYLGDRFNAKTVFVVGLVGVNVTSLLFAVLTDYHALLANQAVSGGFRALLFGPGMVLITAQFSPERRATAMGIFIAGGMSSNVLLNLLGPVLVGPLGWRTLIIIFSVSALVVAVLYMLLGTPITRREGSTPPRIREIPGLLKHPVVWTTGVIQFVRLSVAMGLMFWLPTILVEDKGFSLTLAGLIVALNAAIVAPSNIFGGIISDRLKRPLLVIGVSLVALAISTALLGVVQGVVLVILVIVVNAVFVQLYFGPLFAVPLQYLGSSNAGLLSSLGNLFANLGALATALVMGYIKDATGRFDVGLYVLAALCIVGLAATMLTARLPKPASVDDGIPTRHDDELSSITAEETALERGATPS